jgi:hypothetical protein
MLVFSSVGQDCPFIGEGGGRGGGGYRKTTFSVHIMNTKNLGSDTEPFTLYLFPQGEELLSLR